MVKSLHIALMMLLPLSMACAQSFVGWQYNDRYFSLTIGTGKSGYIGDLSHDKYFQKGLAQASLGLEARLLKKWSARAEIYYYNISGSDTRAEDGSFPQQRNLNFTSNNLEYNLSAMYYINQYAGKYYKRRPTELYLHAGIGATKFNPQTTFGGQVVNLRDIKTENVAYGSHALVAPLGFGVKFTVNEFVNLIGEAGYRFAFTDYLDDVSGSFGGPYDDKLSEAVSNRKFEVGILNQGYYDLMQQGAQRGDNNRRDSYYFLSVKIEAYLPADLFKSKGNKYSKEKIIGKPSGFDKSKK